ncbi:hypothetical protein [Pedobacter aquatilis]|uniref:hypothetical protein n=1 Tax=Pedobacter aquatilis TaxID=351343 RepID=UPI00292E48F1|nr:hypothetical protein [Pedobacter aquatilis]
MATKEGAISIGEDSLRRAASENSDIKRNDLLMWLSLYKISKANLLLLRILTKFILQ